MREGVERSRDQIRLEEFYYTAIYEVLQQPAPHAEKMSKLKELKAKIIRLNNTHRQRLLIDTSEQDRIAGEPPSLHNLLRTRK